MLYLIDGYNLLGQTGHLHDHSGDHDLERGRLALLDRLRDRFGDAAGCATVVFDARKARGRTVKETEYAGVHVFFTRNEEADDLIERMINATPVPARLTVVSNDHRVRDAARRRGCQVQGGLEFWDWLGERPAPPATGAELGDKPEVDEDERERAYRDFADLDDGDEVFW
jgi:predicted RNA-binding protein with PIN domain